MTLENVSLERQILENVSLERHILENVLLERQILETFSMRKCLSNDTFGPIKCAIRNLTF